MNFLSHLYLSGDSTDLLIGNFIADSVKGSAMQNFSAEIQEGIILHRKIDTFTDAHPIVEESKKRLRLKYKKYASVIVDVYYDHFLAINWNKYSNQSLNDFAQNVYSIMAKNKNILPYKSSMFNQYMVKYNILVAYSKLEGIERVMQGMANRTTFESNMEHSIIDLKEHYHLFEEEFTLFFPELRSYVDSQIVK